MNSLRQMMKERDEALRVQMLKEGQPYLIELKPTQFSFVCVVNVYGMVTKFPFVTPSWKHIHEVFPECKMVWDLGYIPGYDDYQLYITEDDDEGET